MSDLSNRLRDAADVLICDVVTIANDCDNAAAELERLESELALMKAIVPMTDSQRNALIEAIITIGDKLK